MPVLTESIPSRYTATSLHHQARSLHAKRIIWANPAWLCVGSALLLSIVGIIAISTTEPAFAARQVAHLCVGLIGAAVVAAPHYRWLERLAYPAMLIATGLLVFVLLRFVPDAIVHPRNGARRWINLGLTDIQPSELAKIAYIFTLSAYLRYRNSYRTLRGMLLPLALSFIPMGLVLIEPNLGMTLLFLPTFFAMLIAAGAKLRHVALVIVLGLSIAPLSYPILRDHQRARIDAMIAQFTGDERHLDDIGFQADRARTLVGAGGWFGSGRDMAANLITYNRLPEEHNDMVFAVIACRWGMFGAVTTWLLFAIFFIGGLVTAATCRDPFGRLVAVGIIASMAAQMAINTGMTIGLMPITGLPLPFVSYGGSSLVATWLMVGIMFNVALRRSQYLVKSSFEFDEPVND